MKVIALASLFASLASAAAPTYFISITGTKQGPIYSGPSILPGGPQNAAQAQAFNFSSQLPISITSAPTAGIGKPSYGPVRVYKRADAGSARLLNALANAETVNAQLVVATPGATGGPLTNVLVYSLTNAFVTSVDHDGDSDSVNEVIELVWQKLTLLDSIGTPASQAQLTL